jgi:AraC-like DNA-binding protein
MHYLISIGIILALTGILLIFVLKKPLQLSDKLLMVILGTFVIKFLLDDASLLTGNRFLNGIAAVFGISSIITCGWYIKYLTNAEAKFGARQLVIYIPLFILIVPIVVVMRGQYNYSYPGIYYQYVLAVMIVLILYYFWFCIDMLRKHRQLIREYYSGHPGNITVNWIVIILALQIGEFLLKGVLAHFFNGSDMQIVTNEYCYIIETFLLVVLGIWQKSIPVFIAGNEEAQGAILPTVDLLRYQQKLEKFMDEQQPYLDPELTIEKLSDLTRIKKLILSQTLNKGFNKNFFTFIKEYRIRHVEEILKKKKQENATIMDIAYESGFNSKTGFNRAFKEVTGKTPTEYIEVFSLKSLG